MPYYPGYAQDPGILAMMRMGITDPTMLAPGMQPAPALGGLPPGMHSAVPGGIPVGDESSFANASTKAGVPLTPDPGGHGYDIPTFAPAPAPGGVPAPAQGGPSGGRSVPPVQGSSPSAGALPYAPQTPQTPQAPQGPPSVPMAPRTPAGATAQPAQPSSSPTPPVRSNTDMAKSFDLFGTNTAGSTGSLPQDASVAPVRQPATHRPPTGPITPGTPDAAAGSSDTADQKSLLGKLDPMSNRLIGMGMGLMSGNRNEQWANALKGYQEGTKDDRAALQERRQALSDKQETEAATAYASMATKAGYPDAAKAMLKAPKFAGDIFTKIIAEQGIDAGKFTMTDDIKNFQYAVKNMGYKGDFTQYQMDLRHAQQPQGEPAFARTVGEDTGKRMNATIHAADSVPQTKRNLDYLQSLLDNTSQGYFANKFRTVGQMAATFGIDQKTLDGWGLPGASVPSSEAADAIIREYIYKNHIGADNGGIPTQNFSEEDRKATDKMGPSLANTPEGNRIMIQKAKIDEDIKADRANSWGQWQQKYGMDEKSYLAWERQYRQETQSKQWYAPLYGELDRMTAQKRAGAQRPGAAGGPPPAGGGSPSAGGAPKEIIYDMNGKPIQ